MADYLENSGILNNPNDDDLSLMGGISSPQNTPLSLIDESLSSSLNNSSGDWSEQEFAEDRIFDMMKIAGVAFTSGASYEQIIRFFWTLLKWRSCLM